MPTYDAGSAAIRVRPSFKDFITETRSELEAMDLHLDVPVTADTKRAEAKVAEFRKSTDESMTVDVDADVDAAEANIKSLRASAEKDVTVDVDADTGPAQEKTERFRQEQERKPVKIPVDADKKAITKAKSDLEGAFKELAKAGTLNLKVSGVVGGAGAISTLLSIAQAAAQASHAVALIPAAGFAALAGIGSAAVGLKNIPDVFKEMTKASTDATDIAEKQKESIFGVSQAAFKLQQAQQGAIDADRAKLRAEQDLNTTYKDESRSLRDMNDQLTDQKLATEDASLGVAEAAKALRASQFDPTADADTRRRKQLDYLEAVQRLKEQRNKTQDLTQDTAEANAKGVEGSKAVIAGKQQVVDATKAEAAAQNDVVAAVEDLRRAQVEQTKSTAGTDLAKAMAKLSPNAKELVNDVHSIGPAWKAASAAAQDALTGHLGPDIQHLADVQLPGLREGMVGINTALNSGLRASIRELSTDTARADFKTALDNSASGFANAAKGAGPLTDAVTKLVTVGSQFLPRFGQDVDDLAERFNRLIQRTAADGSLKHWIDQGITSTKELVQLAEHLGSSIASVFRAAGDNGATLRSLDELTSRMSAFLKSTQGQEDLKKFFITARGDLDSMKPVLADLPGLLKGAYEGFRTWSSIALPFVQALAQLLKDHPALVQNAVVAYLAFKTLGPIFDIVKSSIKGATGAVGVFKQGMADAAEKGSGKLGSAMGGVQALIGGSLGGPWGLAIAAATTGLGFLMAAHEKAAAAADAQRVKLEQLGQTLDEQTGKATKQTLTQASQELEKGGYLQRAKSLGVDPNDLVRAATGVDPGAKDTINARLQQIILEQRGSSGSTWRRVQGYTGLSDADIAAALQGVPGAVKKYTDALPAARQAAVAAGDTKALPDLAQLKNSLNDVGESAATLGGELNSTDSALAKLAESAVRANQAANGTFELTEKGRQSFQDLGVAISQVPDAKTVVVKALTNEQQANLEKLGATVERLPDGTVKIDLNDAQALDDIYKIVTAPYTATVQVNYVPNTQSLSVQTLKALHGDTVPAKATGGRLPRTGPGTERRDGFLAVTAAGRPLARVDGGEWIVDRDNSEKYHRELSAINAGTFPKLPGYETGGVIGGASAAQKLDQFAQSRSGKPYGGAEDCSGFISELVNIASGLDPGAGRMSTANEGEWLAAHGFQTGTGGPAAFRIGWVNDPSMPQGGHTAGTLPSGVNVESGGAAGTVMYGGAAAGYLASLFNQHAYLQMLASGPATSGIGGIGTGDSTSIGTQSVTNPQAPLPGRITDQQLQTLKGRAAVDQANSERNAVYANPASTAQDKLAADYKYAEAQNSLESATKQDTSLLSLQGIFSKAGGIIATGILSGLGLENSILSDSNPYNKAINTAYDFYAGQNPQFSGFLGYAYQPQNLPSIATTSTPQSSAQVNNPALANQVPSTTPGAGHVALAINPDLGSTSINVLGAESTYQPTAGAEQWRGLATQILAREGFNPAQVNIMLAQIQSESGGNAAAVNNWDINALLGHPSRGLLQTIPSTFEAYRDPGLPDDILDPAANMAAALRYYRALYGPDLSTEWGHGHGYDDGGIANGLGLLLKQTIEPERVLNPRQTQTFESALPLLESINASGWSPSRVDPGNFNPAGAGGGGGGHDFSTTIVEPRVANVNDLVDLAERQAAMKAIGLMAALP